MIDYKIVWIDPKELLDSLMRLKELRQIGYKIISNSAINDKVLFILELVR